LFLIPAFARTIPPVKDSSPSPILRFLQGAAYTVIILWGIRTASPVLGPLLLGLLLAYAVVPFPKWLMQRFKFRKSRAIAMTGVAAITSGLYLLIVVDLATARIAGKLPVYEQRLASLYGQFATHLDTEGIEAPSPSEKNVFTPERLREAARLVLPEAGAIISSGLLVSLLAFLFLIEMAEDIGGKRGPVGERLAYYATDSRRYVAVTAKTAGINALVNLIFLVVMGVDTPVVWSLLYFFLDFIPTLGFLVALVPPTFVTLLMLGWKRALVVACGLILTNVIVDNVVTPMFMKQAVDVSFLEITLSLVFWAFLLGLTGAILAIPLTLALKKFFENSLKEVEPALNPSG
jgi:AI-2 transport protein TqsA